MSRMVGDTNKSDSQIERSISSRLGVERCAPSLVVGIAAGLQAISTASVYLATATSAVAIAPLKQSPAAVVSRIVTLRASMSRMTDIISALSPVALRQALQPIACQRQAPYTLTREPSTAMRQQSHS